MYPHPHAFLNPFTFGHGVLSRVSFSPLFIWLTLTHAQILHIYDIILLCACISPKTYQNSSGQDLCMS